MECFESIFLDMPLNFLQHVMKFFGRRIRVRGLFYLIENAFRNHEKASAIYRTTEINGRCPEKAPISRPNLG
jgi:hypothetical protein